MKNSSVIYAILFSGIVGFGTGASGNIAPQSVVEVVLAALSNNSEKQVVLGVSTGSKQHVQKIAPFEEKNLKNLVVIPFISVRDQDRDAFVSGEPYAPQGSLVITTKQGNFCMWEDERGIQGAFRFNPEDPAACPREECLSKKLYDSNVIRAAIVAGHLTSRNNKIRLRLFIDSLGHVDRVDRIDERAK